MGKLKSRSLDSSNNEETVYFNNLAESYFNQNEGGIDLLKRIKRAASPYIKGEVLVIGSGGLVNFEIKNAKKIVLTDIAKELVKSPVILSGDKLRPLENNKKIKCKVASAFRLPFPNNSFDRVVMFNVAHHLSQPTSTASVNAVNKSFVEVKRVLRTKGKFLFLDNCPTQLFTLIQILSYRIAYLVLNLFNKPLPFFLPEKNYITLFDRNDLAIQFSKKIEWGKKVYLPIFPSLSVSGKVWRFVLTNCFWVLTKA